MSQLKLEVILAAIDKMTAPIKAMVKGTGDLAKSVREARSSLKDLEKANERMNVFRDTAKAIAIKSNAIKALEPRLKALREEIAATSTPSKALVREFERVRQQANELKGAKSQLQTKLQRVREELEKAGTPARNLATHQAALHTKIKAASAALSEQEAKLKAHGEQMRRAAAAKAAYDKSIATRDKVAGAGGKIMAAGAAVGLPAGMALKAYADFETAMLGIARQVDGARDDNGKLTKSYYEIGDAVKALSERLPMTANDIAKIVEGGARMGIQGKENLLTYAELTAVMATAFDLPVERVGEDIGKISQLYKVPIKDIREPGDVINWLDDNALSKGGDIIEVMKRIAGTADMVKMNFREAAALGSTFLSLGATAEVAATASNAMIRELSVANMQSKRFKEGLAMLKLEAKDLQLGMSKDATGTIIKVLEAIKALPEQQQLEAATRLFGKEYGDDAAKLASNLDEYRRQLKLVHDEKARGSMQKESDARNDTVNARLAMAKNAFTNLASDLGQALKPALVQTMEKTLSLVQSIRAWAKENPELANGLMKVVKWAALALTVVGGLTLGVAAFLGPIAMMVKIFATFGGAGNLLAVTFNVLMKGIGGVGQAVLFLGRALLMNPIGLAVTAIALAAYLIYKYWEPIKAFFAGLWNRVKEAFDGGLGGILRLIADWSPLGLFYKAFAAVMGYFGIELPGQFSEFGSRLMERLSAGIEAGMAFVSGVIDSIKARFAALLAWFQSIPAQLGALFDGAMQECKTAVDGGLLGITALIVNWSPVGLFYRAFAAVMGYFGVELPAKFTDFGGMLLDGLWSGIAAKWEGLKAKVAEMAAGIAATVRSALGIQSPSRVFAEIGGYTMEGLQVGLQAASAGPLATMAKLAGNLAAAGAVAVGSSLPALAIDHRPPLSASTPAGTAAGGGTTIHITINAVPGMDAQQLAQLVAQEVARVQQTQAAAGRSRLTDFD